MRGNFKKYQMGSGTNKVEPNFKVMSDSCRGFSGAQKPIQSLDLFVCSSSAKPNLSITDLDHARAEEINAMSLVLNLVLVHQMNGSCLGLVTRSWPMMDGNWFVCSLPHDI